MNILQIAGRLGKKPESRFTASGLKVTTFNVATSVRKGGKEDTIWWRVTVWGDRFDKMISYLDKGSAIIVVGEMSKPEIWTDKEGRPQVSLEITADILRFSPFGSPDSSKQEQSGAQSAPASAPASNQNYGSQGNSQSFGDYSATPFAGSGASNSGSSYGQGNQSSYADSNEDAPPF